MENTKEELQVKLELVKSRLSELEEELKSVLIQLEPLEIRKNKIQGDIKYFQNRVKKLTTRIEEIGG